MASSNTFPLSDEIENSTTDDYISEIDETNTLLPANESMSRDAMLQLLKEEEQNLFLKLRSLHRDEERFTAPVVGKATFDKIREAITTTSRELAMIRDHIEEIEFPHKN